MNTKSGLLTVTARLCRLMIWLIQTGWRFRNLYQIDTRTRLAILQDAGTRCLNALNVEIRTHNAPPLAYGSLLVANHISWLDIFVLVSLYPASFIAKTELQKWPIVGTIIRNSGAVFIDRSNRKDIDPVNAAIAETIRSGGNVCFFPESRTSSGSDVLPLKAALFESAIIAKAPIQIAALRYYDALGNRSETVSFANVGFFTSLWQILRMKKIYVQTDFADPFTPETGVDRFTIKAKVESYLKKQVLADNPQQIQSE